MQECKNSVSLLFETSWEVCNKVGGIYTVLSTKAKSLHDTYKDNLVFIGPDVWTAENPSPYFKEYKTLLKNCVRNVVLPYGISIRVGRWLVPGSPIVVLVKFDGIYPHLDEFYGKMWNLYGVDSLHAYGDYDEGCAFGIASSIVIAALIDYLKVNQNEVIAHFNEWTTGMGLLNLKSISPMVSTIFTTHATSIGRSICGNGKPLYDYFTGYNGDQMAMELNMQSKHSLEKCAAHNADCFTTVSDVTAKECEQLLDITPHVVTPNGFEPNFVPNAKKYDLLRKESRKKLLSIAHHLTGKEYDENTFIVATSGRNEYRNKGIDIYIDSLEYVNNNIKEGSKEILAFIMVPAWVKEPASGLLSNLSSDKYHNLDVNYITHRLNNEDTDSISCRLRMMSPNKPKDKVTIIYLPCYLDSKDGVFNIPYYDMMPGLDATIFPSYYEPWGYTPLESIAFKIPTISTDKSGFGQWILSNYTNSFEACGVNIVPRTDSNYDNTVKMIAESLMSLSSASEHQLAKIREQAALTSSDADWSSFISYYYSGFDIAMKRRDIRCGNINFD